MRFYPEALSTLQKIMKTVDCTKQCLYLVADPKNKHSTNAVMLHDGKRKLGSVSEDDAWTVRMVLDRWDNESGNAKELATKNGIIDRKYPFVAACCIDAISSTTIDNGYIRVSGFNKVDERLARKFSDKYRKE